MFFWLDIKDDFVVVAATAALFNKKMYVFFLCVLFASIFWYQTFNSWNQKMQQQQNCYMEMNKYEFHRKKIYIFFQCAVCRSFPFFFSARRWPLCHSCLLLCTYDSEKLLSDCCYCWFVFSWLKFELRDIFFIRWLE